MNPLRRLFAAPPEPVAPPPPPSPTEAARVLSRFHHLNERERIKALARHMRQEMALPAAPALEPRRPTP